MTKMPVLNMRNTGGMIFTFSMAFSPKTVYEGEDLSGAVDSRAFADAMMSPVLFVVSFF